MRHRAMSSRARPAPPRPRGYRLLSRKAYLTSMYRRSSSAGSSRQAAGGEKEAAPMRPHRREREIVQLLSEGRSNKEVASGLANQHQDRRDHRPRSCASSTRQPQRPGPLTPSAQDHRALAVYQVLRLLRPLFSAGAFPPPPTVLPGGGAGPAACF